MINETTTLQEVMRRPDWKEILDFLNLQYSTVGDETIVRYTLFDNPQWKYLAARQARGAIFDKDGEYLCRPFDKFFNLGEHWADIPADDEEVTAIHKIDGSLIKVWYDINNEEVRYSSNGSIDAFRTNQFHGQSLGQLFVDTLGDKREDFETLIRALGRTITHMFELVSPKAKIVVDYPETMVYYLGSRGRDYGFEFDFTSEWSHQGLDTVIRFPKTETMLFKEAVGGLDEVGSEEGLVVKFGSRYELKRIKLKRVEYVAAHHMKGSEPKTTKRLLEYYRTGEVDEILAYFPEYAEAFGRLAGIEAGLVLSIRSATFAIKGGDEKEVYFQMLDYFKDYDDRQVLAVQAKNLYFHKVFNAKVIDNLIISIYDKETIS